MKKLINYFPTIFASLFPIYAIYLCIITGSFVYSFVWLICLILILLIGINSIEK